MGQFDYGLPRDPSSAVLDASAFTQLFTAAQQSGLLPNADAIIGVRDREFPQKRYQKALDTLEQLYVQLTSKAAKRVDALRRQETQYRAGVLKMSPKEWQTKLRKDTEQTQIIERARRRFARVLDGLRVLRASNRDSG